MLNRSLRIKEQLRSGTLAVPGDQWPVFLYADYKHDLDSDDHWEGLFRSTLLVKVCTICSVIRATVNRTVYPGLQAYFHISKFCGKGT